MANEPAPSDRRQHERHACSASITCRPLQGGDTSRQWEGIVVNVARGGVLLVSERTFNAGDTIEVRLPFGDGDAARSLIARVIRCQPRPAGSWLVACQLVEQLTEEELQGILRQSPA